VKRASAVYERNRLPREHTRGYRHYVAESICLIFRGLFRRRLYRKERVMSTCSSSCACGAVGREWWLSFAVTKSPELRTREIENTYSFNSIHSTGLLEASSPFARTTAARGTVPSRALSLPPTNQQVRKHGLVDSRDVDSTYVHSARVFLLALTTLMFRR